MTRSPALALYSRARKRRASPEANLQCAVVEHLKLRGVPGLLYFRIPNDAKRSVQAGVWEKKMGLLPGAADLCILVPGKPALFLELKAAGEKPEVEQDLFGRSVRIAGHTWACIDNIDAALDFLITCGAITRPKQSRRLTLNHARAM